MGRLSASASAPASECAPASKHHFDAPNVWVMSPLGRRLHEALEQDAAAALHRSRLRSRTAIEPDASPAYARPAPPQEAARRRGRCCTGDSYDAQSRLTHKMQKPCGCLSYDPVVLVPASIFGGPREFERTFLEAAKKMLREVKLPAKFPLRSSWLEAVAEAAAEQPRCLDFSGCAPGQAFLVRLRVLPRVRDGNLANHGGAAVMQQLEHQANELLLPQLLRLVEELRALRVDRRFEDERQNKAQGELRGGALAHHRRNLIRDALQDPCRELFDGLDEHHHSVSEGFGQPRVLCRCGHAEHGHERTAKQRPGPGPLAPEQLLGSSAAACEDTDCSEVWATQRHSFQRPASTPAMETATLSGGRLHRPAGRTLGRPGTSDGDTRDGRDSFASQMPFLRKKGKSKPVPASKACVKGAGAETTLSMRTFRNQQVC